MTLTEEQLAERRKGITATDVAKIVGQSPYGCAEDVRLDKMGAGAPFVEHDRVKWGNLLEAPIRKDYQDRHGIRAMGEPGTVRHPVEPWALATPDGIVYMETNTPSWGHEIKTHTSWLSHLYGDPGSDQVPTWELIQCAWNIWVCSAYYGVQIERWDLTVFLDGLPTDYTIWRDPELETALITAARMFWETHVLGGEPVPPDGSEPYKELLTARWPKNDPDKILQATPEQLELIEELRVTREARKGWEKEEERLAQEVKLILGDASSIEWVEQVNGKDKKRRINWKRSKDSQRVSWEDVAAAYRASLEEIQADDWDGGFPDLEAIQANHTTTKPGTRSFTVPRSWSSKK